MAIMDLQGLEIRGSRNNGGGSDASLLLCQRTSSLSITECD
jgi:hypothetical protein